MRPIRSLTALAPTLLLVGLLVGCDDQPTAPIGEDAPVPLALQAAMEALVDVIVVEVTGPGIPVPIVSNLELVDGFASGTVTVPPGPDRTFTALGFDAEGTVTHEGSVTLDVRPGMTAVQIPLVSRGVGVPLEVVVSYFLVAIDPPAAEMNIGETRTFNATVTDALGQPRDVDSGALTWGSSNPVIATADDQGVVTAGGQPGSTRIVVSYEGVAAEAELTVTGDDLLSISVTTSASEVEPGEPFQVVVTVRNRGEEGVSNLVWWLVLPYLRIEEGGCHILELVDTPGFGAHCPSAWLGPGEEDALTFTVRSTLKQGDAIPVHAYIASWTGPEDPYPANNEATAPVAVTHGRIVFASDRGGTFDLYTVGPDGTDLVQVTSSASDDLHPAWAPDRSRIAFIRNGSIWLVNADGSGEVTLLDLPFAEYVSELSWSPDGTRIALGAVPPGSADGLRRLLIVDVETSAWEVLEVLSFGNLSGEVVGVSWSPDGETLLADYREPDSDIDQFLLAFISISTGSRTFWYYPYDGTCWLVTSDSPWRPRWAPDGDRILVDNWNGLTVVRRGAQTEGVNSGLTCSGGFSTGMITLDDPGATDRHADWSPDGSQLIMARGSDGASFDLYTMASDFTGPMLNITNWPAHDFQPSW